MPTTIKKLSSLERLPNTLKLEVLSFFVAKEKKVTSAISKEMKKIADTLSFGPFYMVGGGVNVGSFFDYFTYITLKPRQHIPAKEIINSFPIEDSVELFGTLDDADRYARSLKMKAFHEFLFQPAIFTVNVLQRPSPMKSRDIAIESFKFPRKPATLMSVRSFCVDISQIVPVSGKLEVDFYDDGKITRYGVVNSLVPRNETPAIHRCVVS